MIIYTFVLVPPNNPSWMHEKLIICRNLVIGICSNFVCDTFQVCHWHHWLSSHSIGSAS